MSPMMIVTSSTLLILSLSCYISTTTAFVPHHIAPKWGKVNLYESPPKSPGVLEETNFDDVNLARVLGLQRVKKMLRKYKRQRNASETTSLPPPVVAVAAIPATPETIATVATTATTTKSPPLKMIISGAPASGKGTQCEIIKENFNVVHLSTGDMLRAAVAAQTDVGKLAKEYMDSGKLVPDDVIIGVVKDRLAMSDCTQNGWLLDGFPRTPAQAEALAASGISPDCFLFLNVPDSILVERVVGRRTDPVTGKIYHMTFSPPDDEEILGRLEQRSDDTEEKVKVRLEQFYANVDAVKGSYKDIAVDINGADKPDVVAGKVKEAIELSLAAAV